MSAARHLAIAASATVAMVFGVWWWAQDAWRLSLPDEAIIRQASAQEPKGLTLRCDPKDLAPDAPPDSPERRLENELYRAIVTASGRLEYQAPLVIEQVSLPMPEAHGPKAYQNWSAAAIALVQQAPSRCSELSVDRFPATAHLAPVNEIAADWNRLAWRYNGARLWYAFSRARLNEATGDAVVYYERHCRDGCSIGEWVWLRRDANPWRITGRAWNWIQ